MRFVRLIVPIVGLALAFVIISSPYALDLSLISIVFTIVTFLFGIFMSFSISDRHSRINKIRDNDCAERSALESISNISKVFGKKTHNIIVNSIDKYLVSTLDYTIWDYSETEKEFQELSKKIVSIGKNKNPVIFDHFMLNLEQINNARKQMISVIDDRISVFEKTALLILATVLLVSTLFLKTGTIFSIVAISIDAAVVLLLVLLYKLDNLTWKESERIFEPNQKTFEAIGKLRYYPEPLITNKRVKNKIDKPYRLAIYKKDYPNISDKTIKIIRPKRTK